MEFRFKKTRICVCVFSVAGSEDKTPQASATHHAASSRANQSHTLEVKDNDEEAIGDRWDEEEDWGSLEVGFHLLTNYKKLSNYYRDTCERLCHIIVF